MLYKPGEKRRMAFRAYLGILDLEAAREPGMEGVVISGLQNPVLEHVSILSNRNTLYTPWFGRIFCAEPVPTSAENAPMPG